MFSSDIWLNQDLYRELFEGFDIEEEDCSIEFREEFEAEEQEEDKDIFPSNWGMEITLDVVGRGEQGLGGGEQGFGGGVNNTPPS